MVEYASDHNVHQEWVYNLADLEDGKVLWGAWRTRGLERPAQGEVPAESLHLAARTRSSGGDAGAYLAAQLGLTPSSSRDLGYNRSQAMHSASVGNSIEVALGSIRVAMRRHPCGAGGGILRHVRMNFGWIADAAE